MGIYNAKGVRYEVVCRTVHITLCYSSRGECEYKQKCHTRSYKGFQISSIAVLVDTIRLLQK